MSSASGTRKLSTSDISDVRAHERERVRFREYVLELRLRRSVAMGAFISVSFESRETIRYQIQQMVRVERLMTDVEIQPRSTRTTRKPQPGQLCATMFIEITPDDATRANVTSAVHDLRSRSAPLRARNSRAGRCNCSSTIPLTSRTPTLATPQRANCRAMGVPARRELEKS